MSLIPLHPFSVGPIGGDRNSSKGSVSGGAKATVLQVEV